MSVAELKRQLHTAVENINNAEQLKAMLDIAAIEPGDLENEFTSKELSILKEREEQYKRGEIKAIPWEEVKARLKEKYGF